MQKEIVEPRGANSNKHRTIIIKTSVRRLKTFLRQDLTLYYLTCTELHLPEVQRSSVRHHMHFRILQQTIRIQNSSTEKKTVYFSRFQNFKHSRPEGEIKARCWTKRDSRTKAE
jgi:hypothetical protein